MSRPQTLTHLLYEHHHVGMTWFIFAAIGLLAAAVIFCYGRRVRQLARQEEAVACGSDQSVTPLSP